MRRSTLWWAEIYPFYKGVAKGGGGGHGGHGSTQSIQDKNKDLGNYDKYLPLRDCFLAGFLISGLTKEKYNYNTTSQGTN